MSRSSFVEHVAAASLFGASLGAAIGGVGWVMRARERMEIDVGEHKIPYLLARRRECAEILHRFRAISRCDARRSPAWYRALVERCEFLAKHENGDAPPHVQAKAQTMVEEAKACANKLCRIAFAKGDGVRAHECRMEIESLDVHMHQMLKNVMG